MESTPTEKSVYKYVFFISGYTGPPSTYTPVSRTVSLNWTCNTQSKMEYVIVNILSKRNILIKKKIGQLFAVTLYLIYITNSKYTKH